MLDSVENACGHALLGREVVVRQAKEIAKACVLTLVDFAIVRFWGTRGYQRSIPSVVRGAQPLH